MLMSELDKRYCDVFACEECKINIKHKYSLCARCWNKDFDPIEEDWQLQDVEAEDLWRKNWNEAKEIEERNSRSTQ